jgi:hypothetical protein
MNPESLIELAAWADGTMPDVEDSRRFHDACDPQTITELCQRVLDAEAALKRIAGLEVVVESHADCANVAIHGINIARKALSPPMKDSE